MKKTIVTIILFVSTLALFACSNNENVISIIASSVPHSIILEEARPLLIEKGYDLDITIVNDFATPNPAVATNSADANYFQHRPFLENFNTNVAGPNQQLVEVAPIHIEPLAAYTRKGITLSDINSSTRILISTSLPDRGRLLYILEQAGVIDLKEGASRLNATLEDIIENSTGVNASNFLNPVAPQLLVQTFLAEDSVDLAFINGNFALSADLLSNNNVSRVNGLIESPYENPFVNILVVRQGNENLPKIQALAEILKSEFIANFIINRFGGYVVPAN